MEIWKAGPDVTATVKDLVANHFPKLATVEDEILVIFKEKAGKTGDKVIMGKTAKATPLLGVVGEQEYKFVITLAADEWTALSGGDQRALLFHHLCACGAEENPQTGDMKFYVRLPDVNFFREEVEEFGFWHTSGNTPDPNLILELFGSEPRRQAIPRSTSLHRPPHPSPERRL
jgi:hypothetical protein